MAVVSLRPDLPPTDEQPPLDAALEALCICAAAYCDSVPTEEAIAFVTSLARIVEDESENPPPIKFTPKGSEMARVRRLAVNRLRREVPNLLRRIGGGGEVN